MEGFRITGRTDGARLVLELHGTLDGSSAWEVRNALAGFNGPSVRLDCAGVGQVWDYGAAVLAAGLRAAGRGRVSLENLPDSLRRALRACDLPLELFSPEPAV